VSLIRKVRIAARKGYEILNGNDLLGSSDGIESMGEFVAD
jgi:hypothetical protein